MAGAVLGFALSARATTIAQIAEQVETVDVTPVSDRDGGVIFKGVTTSCWRHGTCSLCDILVIFVNIANLILQIFAIIGVVFLVYGTGFLMLSMGSEERITRGKQIMRASVVGSLIVLGAWQIMAFIILLVGDYGVFSEIKDDQTRRDVTFNPITNWFAIAERCQVAIQEQTGQGFLPSPSFLDQLDTVGSGDTEPGFRIQVPLQYRF